MITLQSVFSAQKARQGDRKTRTAMYWTEGIPTALNRTQLESCSLKRMNSQSYSEAQLHVR